LKGNLCTQAALRQINHAGLRASIALMPEGKFYLNASMQNLHSGAYLDHKKIGFIKIYP